MCRWEEKKKTTVNTKEGVVISSSLTITTQKERKTGVFAGLYVLASPLLKKYKVGENSAGAINVSRRSPFVVFPLFGWAQIHYSHSLRGGVIQTPSPSRRHFAAAHAHSRRWASRAARTDSRAAGWLQLPNVGAGWRTRAINGGGRSWSWSMCSCLIHRN